MVVCCFCKCVLFSFFYNFDGLDLSEWELFSSLLITYLDRVFFFRKSFVKIDIMYLGVNILVWVFSAYLREIGGYVL